MADDACEDEFVMYVLLRTDLGMPKGKLVAQGGHAIHLAIRDAELSGNLEWLSAWEIGSYTKIALRLDDADHLERVCNALVAAGICHVRVVDEGRTAVATGTTTAVGLHPVPRSLAQSVLGSLKLV
jgi:PTH2 family peptidyl-tRNA hydrolase